MELDIENHTFVHVHKGHGVIVKNKGVTTDNSRSVALLIQLSPLHRSSTFTPHPFINLS